MKKILIVLGIILLILLVFTKILRPVIVRDAETHKPIAGAEVSIEVANFATGCGNPVIVKTNSFGFAFSKHTLFPCRISAWKNGYHVNGYNTFSESKSFLVSSLKLHQINNPITPLTINARSKQNQGIDILSKIEEKSGSDFSIAGTSQKDNIDFDFPSIINYGKTQNTAGSYEAKIRFYGEGGIQKITDNREPTNDASASYFAMENLLVAPTDGYQKEMIIRSGESYVAKLRDGEHYFKFHPFIADSFESKESYLCMTTFVNPDKGLNLNFQFIYYGLLFCGENDANLGLVLNRARHFNSDHWYAKAYPSDKSWED